MTVRTMALCVCAAALTLVGCSDEDTTESGADVAADTSGDTGTTGDADAAGADAVDDSGGGSDAAEDGADDTGGGDALCSGTVDYVDNVNPGSLVATLCFDPDPAACSVEGGEAVCAGPFAAIWTPGDTTGTFVVRWLPGRIDDASAGTVPEDQAFALEEIPFDTQVTVAFSFDTENASGGVNMRAVFTMTATDVAVDSITLT